MDYIRARAVRWVDEGWPGWVEVHIVVADGATISLVDKVLMFDGGDQIVPGVTFPAPVRVACDIIGWERDPRERQVAVVVLSYQVQDEAGNSTFHVLAENIDVAK